MAKRTPDFDVALSFAGEDRVYVEKVADHLRDMGLRVFYDKHEAVTLWGKDLYAHLHEVYAERARYTVMFISKSYKRKLWTNHERQSAQVRAFEERHEYILPARFDTTKVPGLLGTTGYVDLHELTPRQLALLIKEKLGPIERPRFFPEEPDLLYEEAKARSEEQKNRTYNVAVRLFESMKLMTPRERHVLIEAGINGCLAKLPKNIHISLGYLARLTKSSREELLSIFARLECLGVTACVRQDDDHADEDTTLGSTEVLEFQFYSGLRVPDGVNNRVMAAVFRCMLNTNCRQCVRQATKSLDWSILSSNTAMNAVHRKRGAASQPSN